MKCVKTKQVSVRVAQWLPILFFGSCGMLLPVISSATDCSKTHPPTAQSDHLRMCALVGIWDTIITGNNRHGYSGEVVAWVDDSVTAVRAAIHDLDQLQCASLEPTALAQSTLLLVTQISAKDLDKNKLFELATNQSLCESAQANPADKLVAFAATNTSGNFHPSTCAFDDLKLPEDFVVLAAGAYSGHRTGFQIDQSGHEGTQIDVAVNHKKPVVLMLGAYEPTIWNIGWTADTQIVAVLASGYHRQIIAGLKGNVPTLISSYDNRGKCGYFYVAENKLSALNPLSRRLFNQAVGMVYPAQEGKVLVGEPIVAGVGLLTSSSASPESFRDANVPLAGHAGLEDAVEKGLLRSAVPKDAQAWVDAVSEYSPQRDEPPIKGQGMDKSAQTKLFHAYVVLKPFTYPAGLYGANLATFFIPKGIPKPKGNPGHSVIYDFNTISCQGAMCGQ